jgi:hypothetical protein
VVGQRLDRDAWNRTGWGQCRDRQAGWEEVVAGCLFRLVATRGGSRSGGGQRQQVRRARGRSRRLLFGGTDARKYVCIYFWITVDGGRMLGVDDKIEERELHEQAARRRGLRGLLLPGRPVVHCSCPSRCPTIDVICH